ncbi:hypothetical protein [Actinokineospora sp. NPDC004072]
MVRRPLIAAAVVLVLAACGNDDPGTPEPAPEAPTTTVAPTEPQGDPVAWAERVCSSVSPEVAKLSKGPNIDPNNPKAAKGNLISYLDTLVDALERMSAGIGEAGDPPVPDGDIAADRAVQTLQKARDQVQRSRDEFAAADVSDPEKFKQAFTKVGSDLQKLAELENPMAGLRGNEQLDAAFKKAASCRTLAGTDASGSAGVPTSIPTSAATRTS